MSKRMLVLSSVIMVLTTFSCRRSIDTPVKPDPNPVIGKIARIDYGDGSYDSIYYQSNGSVKKIKNHTVLPAPYDEIYVFEYDASGKVKRITDNHGEYFDYGYIGTQLTVVSHYVGGIKNDYRLYDYLDGKLVDIEEYYRLSITLPGYDYTANRKLLYYPDGNLKQEVNYSFDPVTRVPVKDFTIDYSEYDSNPNPEDAFSRFIYQYQIPASKNNVRKIVTKDEVNGFVTEFTAAYTYNDFLNPLTKKVTYTSGGQLHTQNITYTYY